MTCKKVQPAQAARRLARKSPGRSTTALVTMGRRPPEKKMARIVLARVDGWSTMAPGTPEETCLTMKGRI